MTATDYMRRLALGLTTGALLTSAASAQAEIRRDTVRPGQTITWTTHKTYADDASWTIRVNGSSSVFAETVGSRGVWVYKRGTVISVRLLKRPHAPASAASRWKFRMTNLASRPRRVKIWIRGAAGSPRRDVPRLLGTVGDGTVSLGR